MKDIDNPKYSFRKEWEYDDDIGILFYKGEKVVRVQMESFCNEWVEEDSQFDNLNDFFKDVCGNSFRIRIDPDDSNETWCSVWDKLEYDKITKSMKYKNFELVILDI